jgi:hypothetical protein
VDVLSVAEDIKVTSWRWWIGRVKSSPCMFYEWLQEPIICILR